MVTDPELEHLWESIETDRSKGSRELLLDGLRRLKSRLSETGSTTSIDVVELCRNLSEIRPEMTIFRTAAARLYRMVDDNPEPSPEAFVEALNTIIGDYRDSMKQLVEAFRDYVEPGSTVVVFSRSGTVLQLLRAVPESLGELRVLESHPGDEGTSVANELREAQNVTFYYDNEVLDALDGARSILIGADGIDQSGKVLNKIGSRLLGTLGGGTDLTVCAETAKITSEDLSEKTKQTTVDSPEALSGTLSREHPLFEVVPSELIDVYLTDRGRFTGAAGLLEACTDIVRAHRRFSGVLDPEDR